MARTVQVHLLDDLDGSTAAETVKFSLDGLPYEIDLSSENSDRLRKTVAKYIVAGRRSSHGITTGVRHRHRGGFTSANRASTNQAGTNRAHSQAIRAWAKSSGYEISDRGRIPANLVELFEKDTNR